MAENGTCVSLRPRYVQNDDAQRDHSERRIGTIEFSVDRYQLQNPAVPQRYLPEANSPYLSIADL